MNIILLFDSNNVLQLFSQRSTHIFSRPEIFQNIDRILWNRNKGGWERNEFSQFRFRRATTMRSVRIPGKKKMEETRKRNESTRKRRESSWRGITFKPRSATPTVDKLA